MDIEKEEQIKFEKNLCEILSQIDFFKINTIFLFSKNYDKYHLNQILNNFFKNKFSDYYKFPNLNNFSNYYDISNLINIQYIFFIGEQNYNLKLDFNFGNLNLSNIINTYYINSNIINYNYNNTNYNTEYIKNDNNNINNLKTNLIDLISPFIIPINTDKIIIDPSLPNEIKNILNNRIEIILRNFKTVSLLSIKWLKNIIKLINKLNLINESNFNDKNFNNNIFDLNSIFNNSYTISNLIKYFNDINFSENIFFEKKRTNNKAKIYKFNKINFILIGASKSLDDKIKDIKNFKNVNDIIFCIDNAYFTCLKNGITPHFVISLDPASFVKLFFPKSFLFIENKNSYNEKIPELISPVTINPDIFINFSNIFLFNPGIDFDDGIFKYIFNYIKNKQENNFNSELKEFFKKLQVLNLNITNVGSASLIILKIIILNILQNIKEKENLNIDFEIFTFGIDYKFHNFLYYTKETFFENFLRKTQNYLKTPLNENIKKTLSNKENKLFDLYKFEFLNEFNNLNDFLNSNLNSKSNIITNNLIENYLSNLKLKLNIKNPLLTPLLSYFYIKKPKLLILNKDKKQKIKNIINKDEKIIEYRKDKIEIIKNYIFDYIKKLII